MMLRYSVEEGEEADLGIKTVIMTMESKRTGEIVANGCERAGGDSMNNTVFDGMVRLAR